MVSFKCDVPSWWCRAERAIAPGSIIVARRCSASLQYADGVMLATDTLASYGTMAMFKVRCGGRACWPVRLSRPRYWAFLSILKNPSRLMPCSCASLCATPQDVERIAKIGDSTLVAAGGEFSDFQQIQHMLGDLTGGDRVSSMSGRFTRFLSCFWQQVLPRN